MANITVSPASKNYGSVRIGSESAAEQFTVTNATSPVAAVSVSDIVFASPFEAKLSTEPSSAYRDTISSFSLEPFNPDVNNSIRAMVVQTDNKILIGGDFTRINGSVTTRTGVARINSDGTPDTAFLDARVSMGIVYAVGYQSDGKVIIGGSFRSVGGVSKLYLARLNVDGSLDASFVNTPNGDVYSIVVQPDDKIIIGGAFTTIGATSRKYIARINADGSLDPGFDPDANNWVLSVCMQADGKILVGGYFVWIAGTSMNRIARLNSDGTIDGTFTDPNSDIWVDAIAVQADNKIVVGGYFTSMGGSARNKVARLNSDGTIDATFADPLVSDWVNAVAIQADGKILVGGNFTTVGAVSRYRIARLNTDGTLDAAFDPNCENAVLAISVLTTGKILIAGYFTLVSGTSMNRIARLTSSGGLDSTGAPVLIDVIAAPTAPRRFSDTVVVTSQSGATIETNNIALACVVIGGPSAISSAYRADSRYRDL